MIQKKSLFWKTIVVIVILAVTASSFVLAVTMTTGSQKLDASKSADTSSTVNSATNDIKVSDQSKDTAPKTNVAATASKTSAPDTVSSSSVAVATPAGSHGVGILKSADPIGYVNENVTYRINVFNPSDFNLSKINVTDTMLKLNTTIPFMTAGNKTGVTYVLNRTVLANDTNPLINTASVEAIDSEGVRSTATTQAITTITQRFLDIKKSGPTLAHELDPIKYTIVVKNVGNASLSNVTVADEKLGFSWLGDLSINETNMFNLTYVVPANTSGPLINTATATAMLNGSKIYAEAKWTVNILHPKLHVNKTVTPEKDCEGGGNVTYKIVVTNFGDTALYNITLVDSVFGKAPAKLIPTSLLPGQSVVWTFNATAKQCGPDVVTATGVDALGRIVKASDRGFLCFETNDHEEDCHHESCNVECKDD
jgi:hypothetical protein